MGGGGGIPACIASGIPACLSGLRGEGVVSQYALQVSRPTPKGEVEGSGLGGVSRPTPGRSPGPHPEEGLRAHTGRVSRPTPGGYPSMH